jgi:hypothetical protein
MYQYFNMKKLTLTLLAFSMGLSVFAQKKEEEEEPGFNWNRVFVGGSLALGFGSSSSNYDYYGSFVIGANPEIGYSLSDWADVGFAFNAIYNSLKYRDEFTLLRIKQTSFNYGVGVFARLHLFKGVFIQGQPEYNWIKYNITQVDQSSISQKFTLTAGSILAGVGFGQRLVGESNFFTVIMLDLGTEKYSPYKDGYGRAVPVIRGGVNIYLGKGKKK